MNPSFQVDLTKDYHIHTVHVLLGVGCCNDIDIEVNIKDGVAYAAKQRCFAVTLPARKNFHVFQCSPPVRGRHVTINVTGENVPLVMCGLAVYGFGESGCYVLRFCFSVCLVNTRQRRLISFGQTFSLEER